MTKKITIKTAIILINKIMPMIKNLSKIIFSILLFAILTTSNLLAQNQVLRLNNAYVNVGNSSTLKPSNEITVEAIVKPDNYVGSGWGGAGYILGDGRD